MEIKLINTQRALSPTSISLADYVINPYRGCAFACLYCYARENKNVSSTIAAKSNITTVLRKELRLKRPRRVLLGSTTECFQPAEKKLRLTQEIMEILNQYRIPFTILTKSHLIADDLELIAANPANKIYFTVNCAAQATIEALENGSSSLTERLAAIKAILAKKIALRLHCGPFIPYLCYLDKIITLLPAGINEIGIELYHRKMGNFTAVKAVAATLRDPQTAQDLDDVYTDEAHYQTFCERLRLEAIVARQKYPARFFLTIPPLNDFYATMDYETPL